MKDVQCYELFGGIVLKKSCIFHFLPEKVQLKKSDDILLTALFFFFQKKCSFKSLKIYFYDCSNLLHLEKVQHSKPVQQLHDYSGEHIALTEAHKQ